MRLDRTGEAFDNWYRRAKHWHPEGPPATVEELEQHKNYCRKIWEAGRRHERKNNEQT